MKAIMLKEGFGLEALEVTELPDPRPGPGEVLVRMRAVSLNYRDLLVVKGLYNRRQPLPLVPCSDGVGEIVELGEGVAGLAIGQRVASLFFQGWEAGPLRPEHTRTTLGSPLAGVLQELRVFPESGVIPVPRALSDTEAATLPCAGLTAWSALVTEGGLQAGDTVLVQGTGGVSMFALQFARLMGARVLVTSSSDAKLSRARSLGAELGINYLETPDWPEAVLEATDGRGVDHVVEVGGAGTLGRSLKAVRLGGRVSIIGVLSGAVGDFDLIPVLMRGLRLQGIMVGHKESFTAMNQAIADGGLRPVVDGRWPFTEARAALEHMAAGRHFGKLCLEF